MRSEREGMEGEGTSSREVLPLSDGALHLWFHVEPIQTSESTWNVKKSALFDWG